MPDHDCDDRALLDAVARIAREAGELILRIYEQDFEVQRKVDASPVTLADLAAEAHIVPALQRLRPDWPVVAEEAVSRGEQLAEVGVPGQRWWLVDPLDGTREFIARNGEFTVNIALMEGDAPLLGVVHLPVPDRMYGGLCGVAAQAWVQEGGGQRRAIACRTVPDDGLVVACSRSHGDEAAQRAWLGARTVQSTLAAGSSLKFGLLAQGQVDVYPRLGRTMEWDIAAGHAVLAAAGGAVTDPQGQRLRYGKRGFENPHFVAWGRRCG